MASSPSRTSVVRSIQDQWETFPESSFRRDAETSTRDARAPQSRRQLSDTNYELSTLRTQGLGRGVGRGLGAGLALGVGVGLGVAVGVADGVAVGVGVGVGVGVTVGVGVGVPPPVGATRT
jgi:hypothetical protein